MAERAELEQGLRDELREAFHRERYNVHAFSPTGDERDEDDHYALVALKIFKPVLDSLFDQNSVEEPATAEMLGGVEA